MSKITMTVWGREFELPIHYQNYEDEDITEIQKQTVLSLSSIEFAQSEQMLKQYLIEKNSDELTEVNNVFKYVMPHSILIPRDPVNRVFGIMCDYRMDIEHGLTVVFENEYCKEIGPQDIIL